MGILTSPIANRWRKTKPRDPLGHDPTFWSTERHHGLAATTTGAQVNRGLELMRNVKFPKLQAIGHKPHDLRNQRLKSHGFPWNHSSVSARPRCHSHGASDPAPLTAHRSCDSNSIALSSSVRP